MRPARQWMLLVAVLAAMVGASAGAHHMDSANTQVTFEVNHLGLRWVTAVFHELTGDIVLDPDRHGGQLSVVVSMASIDCNSTFWDERLRSPQWFDTARYPQMIYRSSHIDFNGGGRATVYGDLTLRGVTRPVMLAVTDIDCPEAAPGVMRRCRFVGHAQLRRSDFGLAHAFWQGGDFVQILVRGT